MYTRLLKPDKISHTQSMVAIKETPHKLEQTFIPLCEKVV